MELLEDLNARGTTVLVASHDMMVIERMNKRVVTLEDGAIVHDTGAPSEMRLPEDLARTPVTVAETDTEAHGAG
jgi:ABC-type multidrug transport system ATPase subunit